MDWIPNKMCGDHKRFRPPEKRYDFVRRHARGFHLYSVVPDKRFTRQKRRCNPALPFRAMLCSRVVDPSHL
jgi:hypothetical protein